MQNMHKSMSDTGMSMFYAVNGTFAHQFLHDITGGVADLTKWVDRFQSGKRCDVEFGDLRKAC